MRFLTSCALLLGAVQAEDGQFIPTGGKTLEEVYGPMAEVDEVVPWYERGIHRNTLPSNYFNVRTKDHCIFPLEVYIIQDETASFTDNFIQMKDEQLVQMFNTLSEKHPNSTFGVGTHRDIPIWSLGEPKTDYCWDFRLPLQPDWKPLYDTYDKLVSTGGGDAPEYQFGSIIAACQSKTSGWSNPLASRLVVVSTDAQPHFEDDGFKKPEYNLGRYSGRFEEDNATEQCITQYYPQPRHVKTALNKREAYAAFLIFDGNFSQGGKPIDAWKWFNSYIEQTPEFVSNVQDGAKDFWHQLSKIIKKVEDAECVHEPSTTSAPTTTTTSTTHTSTTQPPTTTTTSTTHTSTTQPPTTTTASTTHTSTTQPPTTTTASTADPPTTEDSECPQCPEGDCPCPAVKIMLRDKPVHLRLEVNNTVVM